MGLFKKARKVLSSGVNGAALEVAGSVASKVIESLAKLGEGHTGKKEKEIILQQALYEHLKSEGSTFHDFFLAYEGSAADQHVIIKVIRGLVRPLLTLYLVALFSWFGYRWMSVDVERMDAFMQLIKMVFAMNVVSLVFWFGDRAIQRTGLMDMAKTWAKNRPANGKG